MRVFFIFIFDVCICGFDFERSVEGRSSLWIIGRGGTRKIQILSSMIYSSSEYFNFVVAFLSTYRVV